MSDSKLEAKEALREPPIWRERIIDLFVERGEKADEVSSDEGKVERMTWREAGQFGLTLAAVGLVLLAIIPPDFEALPRHRLVNFFVIIAGIIGFKLTWPSRFRLLVGISTAMTLIGLGLRYLLGDSTYRTESMTWIAPVAVFLTWIVVEHGRRQWTRLTGK